MASNNIIGTNQCELSKLQFCPPIKNSRGGQMVPVLYSGHKFMLQTPFMKTPFGLSELILDGGEAKYTIPVSFKGRDQDKKIDTFCKIIENLDDIIKTNASSDEFSQRWFGKKMSAELVDELYRPCVAHSKMPEKYAPTMKLKVRTRPSSGDLDLKVYNMKQQEISHTEIKPGSEVRCIIEFAPMWFVNKTFGISVQVVQVQMKPSQQIQGFAFNKMSDDSDSEQEESYDNEEF